MPTHKAIVMCTEHATGALVSEACKHDSKLAPPSSQQSTVEPLYAGTIGSKHFFSS